MGKYKISVSIDKDNYFWIVVDNGRFIREPTEYDLRQTKLITYNQTNVCPRCREEAERDVIELTDKSILYPKNARIGDRTGEWVCNGHRRELMGGTKCKISVSKEEGNYFWIVVDKGEIIKNPVNLKYIRIKSYSKTNICPRCREELGIYGISELADNSILYPGNARHDIDMEGNQCEEWVCKRHYNINYEAYKSNSTNNIIKSLSNRRIGNLKDPRQILGDNCQECTCIWLGTEDLNKNNDNFRSPIDHSSISYGSSIMIGGELVYLSGKIPQTIGRRYDTVNRCWNQDWKSEQNKKFDILISYCISEDGNVIERIYIFPKSEIIKRRCVAVYKNPTDRWGNPITSWHQRYRVKDENVLGQVNKIWKEIINKNKKDRKVK